jgi:hypothetical protein
MMGRFFLASLVGLEEGAYDMEATDVAGVDWTVGAVVGADELSTVGAVVGADALSTVVVGSFVLTVTLFVGMFVMSIVG